MSTATLSMQATTFKKKTPFYFRQCYFGKGCALSVAFHLTLLTCFIIIERRGFFLKDYSNLEDVKSVHYIEISNFNQTSSAPIVEQKSDDLQIAGTLDITKQIGYKEQVNQQVVQEVQKIQSTTEVKQIEKIEKEKVVKIAKKDPVKETLISEKTKSITKEVKRENVEEDTSKQMASLSQNTSLLNDNGSGSGATSETKDVSGNSNKNAAQSIGKISASYEQIILSKLQKVKRYPNRALSRGLEGDVVLHLEVSSNGEVVESEIENSSGFTFFDEEVLEMVKRASPFPSANSSSASSGGASLTSKFVYTIPVAFRLDG